MKHNKFVYLLIIFTWINLGAQIDEQVFFNRVNSIYHGMDTTNVTNFSVLITSDYFEFQAGEKIDHDEYSPIEFIWVKPRQLYFNRTNFPANSDSAQQTNVFQLQNEMFQELRGIFMDWQRFLGGKLLFDLAENYVINSVEDTVHITFDSYENNIPVIMKFYFGKNALCFRIETIYQSINQKIITYPTYVLVDNKWLCTEWTVKILQNAVINSGFNVKFKSAKYKKSWLPVQALIQVQTRQKLNQTFTRLYKFRNLEVNRDLKTVKN